MRYVSPGRRGPSGGPFVAVSVIALTAVLSGCATVAETVLTSVVEEVVDGDRSDRGGIQAPEGGATPLSPALDPSPRRGGEQGASVYVAGPIPGWERGPFLLGSGPRSSLFTASPYRGYCRSLINFSLQGERDPFGPVTSAPLDPFDMGNSLGIDPDYVPLGRVMVGGAGPQHYQWEPMALLSRSEGGCDFLWFRLISFGRDEGVETIHR